MRGARTPCCRRAAASANPAALAAAPAAAADPAHVLVALIFDGRRRDGAARPLPRAAAALHALASSADALGALLPLFCGAFSHQ